MRKNRIFYWLYLVIVFYFAMIYFNYGLYVLFYFSLALPFLAFLYSLCLRGKIRISWGQSDMNVQRDSLAYIAVSAENRGFLPTGITEIRFSVTDVLMNTTTRNKKSIVLSGRGVTEGGFRLMMNHSGMMRVSVESVRVCEPLGLFSHTIRLNLAEATYIVMPQISLPEANPWVHNPYAYVEEEVYSTVKPGDDPSELFGVREYIPGDKQNRIHWNLTAKQDELMVKQLGLPIDCAALILLDLFCPATAEAANVIYDTVFSLSLKLVLTGHRHWLSWVDGATSTVRRELVEEEEDVYALIPQIFSSHGMSSSESIAPAYFAAYPRERFRNIFYVAGTFFEEIRKEIREARGDAYVVCFAAEIKGETEDDTEWKERVIRPDHVAEDIGSVGEVSGV